jgi:hypothetical protein
MSKTNTTKTVNLQPLQHIESVMMGCDPEFFFVDGRGKVIGSEKVLPEKGLKYDEAKPNTYFNNENTYNYDKPIFIIDGVQAEINPEPNTCRALLANDIHACFLKLRKMLKKNGHKLSIKFDPLVNITQKELDSLSEKSRIFGCDPSLNIYQTRNQARIRVNPKKYLKRSAGGHIHLGADTWQRVLRRKLKNAEVVVPILDLVVANTCVLIDRHPGNKERRANYGRCGEYRIKPYGIEYRSISNFWLNAYQLMSFVMGLSRQAVDMIYESKKGNDYIKALTDAVSKEDVIKAVQNNDWDLAYTNFLKIEPILLAAGGDGDYTYPINKRNIDEFHYFVNRIKENGLEYWFKHDPFTHWCGLPDGHDRGWESFARNRIRRAMKGTYIPTNKVPVVAVEV